MGCQTYTWQMSFEKYSGKIPHILDVIQSAKFSGFEPEVIMLGDYESNPSRLVQELNERNLSLGALCVAWPWRNSTPTEEEQRDTRHVFDYLKEFPGVPLILVQLPYDDRSNLRERQQKAIANINWVAERAQEVGIRCAYHPNSPTGSVFRTREDYEVLFDGLDLERCGYAPDTGHIANGGMDVMEILTTYRSHIRHVHFKDIDTSGAWTAMGRGVINHVAVVEMLRDTGYDGWVMVEEESEDARRNPDEMTLVNGHYVEKVLRPLLD